MYGKSRVTRRPRIYRKRALVRKRTRVAKPTTKMVKAIVKKEMARDIENKEVCTTDNVFLMFQNALNTITGPRVETLTPTIVQGVGENGRIGNSLKMKRMFLRGYLSVASSALDTRVLAQVGQWNVRLFIGKLKNSINQPNTTDLNILLRTGASTTPFDSSNGLSLCRTVNSELFTIYYDKIHKIGMQNGQNLSVATGIHNNDYKLSKIIKIDLTKYIKKNIIFTEGSNQPTNMGLYMFGGLCDSLCSGYTSDAGLVNFIYDLEYSYEDA